MDAKKKDLALLLAGKYTAADPVLEDGDVQYLRMDENGRLLLNAIVTAEVADSKIKGSPDGETWVPVKLDAEGNLMVKFPAAQEVKVSGSLPAFAVIPNVAVASSFDTLRPMVGATKTASGVASEVFAGASRKAGRRGLAIKNEHPYLRLRIDGAAVTDTTGVALEPFAQAIFALDPAVDVPVYVISEAGLVKYGVVEW